MYAISRALVCDCVSDVFIQFHDMRPSLRHRKNILVREHPEFSIRVKFLVSGIHLFCDGLFCLGVSVNPSVPPWLSV